MKKHSKHIVVSEDDLDDNQHVNNVRYLHWVQDIAKEHWELAASEKDKKEVVWFAMDHHIAYKNPAFLGEQLVINTYVEKMRGAISTRVVEITNPEKELLICKTVTNWCMMNKETQKPARMSNEMIALFV
ncbi:acyl-CoA thioesterase [Spongiivirga citrea]|uniref:Acyl-CoA thioesterase n=1 Tax=Spongiivirga citrea TaxID=1481457 RepID=A0A6M0CUS1_9FLAO|nr:acyl-ACP thioesterase domain-containing protein [Spongiivirga citrea]NER17520.1 acyl-CoA thioesterase [Spongiivirga citrea]